MDPLTSVDTEGVIAPGESAPQPDRWSPVSGLPTTVLVAVPVPAFRLRDLLALQPGNILSTAWRGERELPLLAGDVQFAWVEFEVTDEKLGARVTRLR